MQRDVLRNLVGVGRSTHLPRRMGDAAAVTGERQVYTWAHVPRWVDAVVDVGGKVIS